MTFRDGSSKVYLFCFTLDKLSLAFFIAKELAPLQHAHQNLRKKGPNVLKNICLEVSQILFCHEKI